MKQHLGLLKNPYFMYGLFWVIALCAPIICTAIYFILI